MHERQSDEEIEEWMDFTKKNGTRPKKPSKDLWERKYLALLLQQKSSDVDLKGMQLPTIPQRLCHSPMAIAHVRSLDFRYISQQAHHHS